MAGIDRSVPSNVTEAVLNAAPEGLIREHLLYAARTTHAPPLYHVVSILPSIAHMLTIAGYQVWLDGQLAHPHLIVALIGDSGSAKSTSAKRARSITRKAMRKTMLSSYRDPYLVASGSPEGVFHEMKSWYMPELSCTPVILWQDELTQLLRKDTFADMMCQVYDGESLARHLRGHQAAVKKGDRSKGDEDVINPVVSGVFCSTPANLEETVKRSQVGGGLFSRIQLFHEHVSVDQLLYEPPSVPEHEALVTEVFSQWLTWFLTERRLRDPSECVLRLSDEANNYIRDSLWAWVKTFLVDGSRLGALLTRTVRHAKLISLLFAAARLSFVADKSDAVAAVNLCAASVKAAQRLDGTLAVSEERKAIDVLESIVFAAQEQGISHRDAMRRLRQHGKVERDRALSYLLEAEVIVMCAVPTGGRPTTLYVHKDFVAELSPQQLH